MLLTPQVCTSQPCTYLLFVLCVPANQNKTLQEKAKAVLRRQMKHVMFTDPEIIQAGERVTLYYNPDDTMLAGSE